jgi:hypothetical protein
MIRRNDPWRREGDRREVGRVLFVRFATALLTFVGTLTFLNHQGVVADLRGAIGVPQDEPTGTYEFLYDQPRFPGVPVTYSSCDPIHVVINDAFGPKGADGVIEEALVEVERASGLHLVVDGRTSEPYSSSRPLRKDGEWNPVLIAWSSPDLVTRLEGSVGGLGGSRWVDDSRTGYRHLVTGGIVLDTPDMTRFLERGARRSMLRGLVQHELGHLLGLAHVDDEGEMMNPHGRNDGRMGPGDLVGLARAGSGTCFE